MQSTWDRGHRHAHDFHSAGRFAIRNSAFLLFDEPFLDCGVGGDGHAVARGKEDESPG